MIEENIVLYLSVVPGHGKCCIFIPIGGIMSIHPDNIDIMKQNER